MRKLTLMILGFIIIISTMSSLCYATDNSMSLTEDERAFIEKNPVIKLGVDSEFVPFEFIDKNGVHKGISADYLSLISKKTGLQFEIIKDLSWPQAYDMALSGDVDMLAAVGKTFNREEHFLFSDPYYYFKRVIVTRDNNTSISGIEELDGLTVAVQRNSSHHSYLLSNTKLDLSLYDSVEVALTAVVTGSEEAFLGNLATINYLIRSSALTDLRIISFEAEKEQALYFATGKDWPELISIINKALNTITESERTAINSRWIGLEQEMDYGPFLRILYIIGALVLVIMAVSFYWIAILRKEVEKRKLIQIDLERAKQEADEANEFKSNFMARMSHEIRTPLNAITGMAYLLKKTNLSLTQMMYTDRITQASSNMLSIINDILDFSKIEAGKVELENISFSMDQVIQDVVNIVSYKIEEQKIGFKLYKDPSIPNWFFGDPKRIEQILLNVLNNAVKFTDSGEVSLDIRLLATEIDKYHISFSVKDTGIGMSQEQIANLFIPFTQGDISINRRFGGSGLGLSIVKNLVDMMDGEIQVFGTAGEGSTFIVYLTLIEDRKKEEEYIRILSANHFKNIKTLVLEKNESDAKLIDDYLSAFGMECEITSSPDSALTMLETADGKSLKHFDLLIVDYETPLEGGLKFMESIGNNSKISITPNVIMLLPMLREDLLDMLEDYSVDKGIGKPIIPSVLFNTILDIFSLKAMLDTQPSVGMDDSPVSLDKQICVLVVDDNKTNQLIAKSLLQQVGIESILADDGKFAVDLYKQHIDKINLVLMDLHMPVMNGYEAAEEIRKISETIPIVAMTADVILGVREKCNKSGIYHYISKPFDPDDFLNTIKGIISEYEENKDIAMDILQQSSGLKNMGGNKEIYLMVLKEYFNENQDTIDKLNLSIIEKRYDDASQIVHKIKSSSGSIGALKLYKLSIKLQEALNEGKEDEILPMKKKLVLMLRKLLSEISDLIG
ncbi:MAG: transporter substrate-binding domain-containing protein [Tissierellales bacterium]